MFKAAAGLPPVFWWLFLGVLLMALATFVFPFLALFLRGRGFSKEQTGLVVALFGAGSIPAGPLAGWLADKVGRRPTLVGALVGAAAMTALLPAISSAPLIAVATLVLGVAVHAYWPAANAVVADLLPPERYADAFGLMYWERNAGIAISFAVGGAVAAGGFGRLFLADAATTLLFAAVVLLRIPETRPVAAAPSAVARGWGAALQDRHLRNLMVLNVALLLALFQFMVAVPIVMTQHGLTSADYGLAMAVNGTLIVLLQPWTGRYAQRFDPAHVLAAASLLVGCGYAAYTVCVETWQYAAATALWSLGEILMVPAVSALVAQLSPPDLRGRYQGLFSLSFGLGLALAPAIGGTCLERLGANALWAGAAGLCALVAVGHLAAGRLRRGPAGGG